MCIRRSGRPAVGEVLECDREPRNCTDRHAVAVLKDSVIIGHMGLAVHPEVGSTETEP